MNSRDPLLKAWITRKAYNGIEVLRELSLETLAGRFQVLLGPSGSGKTTLLKIIAGLDRDFDGQILLSQNPVTQPSTRIGLMFQDVRLFPWMTVDQNIRFPQSALGRTVSSQSLIESVGLPAAVLSELPLKLSGGMARRVALARALAGEPQLLLLDEPFSDLDVKAKYSLYQLLLQKVGRQDGPLSAIMVTHDVTEAAFLADEVLVLSGRHPNTITASVPVGLPHPRRVDSQEFAAICGSIMNLALSDLGTTVATSPGGSEDILTSQVH